VDPGGTCQKGNNRLGKGFGAPIRCIRGISCIDTVGKLIISEELGVLRKSINTFENRWGLQREICRLAREEQYTNFSYLILGK
jgi:hypothetical protein